MLGMASFLGMMNPAFGGSIISSIQQVKVTIAAASTSGTATITSVDTTRTAIFFQGCGTSELTSPAKCYSRCTLTNATTVTVTRNTQANTGTVTLQCLVVEFAASAITRVQYGTITMTAATSNTATITSVDTSKSVCLYLGWTTTMTTTSALECSPTLVLTNATTVTASRGSATNNTTASYCVLEFASGITTSIQAFTKAAITTTTTTETSTLSSVTTGNTMLLWDGFKTTLTGAVNETDLYYSLALTNATTVTYTRIGTANTNRTLCGTAIEFASGKVNSKQSGTITLDSVTSNTSTITSVVTGKTIVPCSGWRTINSDYDSNLLYTKLNSATQIITERNTANGIPISSYQVMEFL